MKLVFMFVIFSVCMTGCMTMGSGSPSDKRAVIQSMKNKTLVELYQRRPEAQGLIGRSKGYAVFSNANVNLLLASFGAGYGVVIDNNTGKNTYMNMGELGLGIGLGVKDFRIIMAFHTKQSLTRFLEHGWAFGGQADAAAKAGDKGEAIGKEITVDDVTLFQLTENGLALQATIKGTKFWSADELN